MSAPAESSGRRSARRTWLGLLVPAVLLFAGLLALGTWQLQRKTWKENLIATLNDRQAAAPSALSVPDTWAQSALSVPDTWARLDRSSDEYRRVAFPATFDHAKEALVYAAASAFRPDVSGRGYWIFTPARLAGGAIVMVNRGFVPEERKDAATRSDGQVAGPVEIVGTLRWPEGRTWFSPVDDPAHNLWFVRDPAAIAAGKGVGRAAPFYVEQESPVPPGGWPKPGKLVVRLRNEHLQYAITWYGLALVLVVAFVAWALTSRREAAPADKRAAGGPSPSL